jgi:methionine sulfoxide reductase heme-binding subunit
LIAIFETMSSTQTLAPVGNAPRPRRAAPAADWIPYAKAAVWVAALWPAGSLVFAVFQAPETLGANPAETILHVTGDWTLQFLLLSLAVTPLRRLTGWNALIRFRRLLGLFAFFYGVLHASAYVGFDRFFQLGEIAADIWKRPFITVGFAALLLMTPLAITSTKGWIRRLGGPRWNRLHQLVYAVALLGVLHYWWLVKRDLTWPLIYAGVLVVLLGIRLYWKLRPRQSRRRAALHPSPAGESGVG